MSAVVQTASGSEPAKNLLLCMCSTVAKPVVVQQQLCRIGSQRYGRCDKVRYVVRNGGIHIVFGYQLHDHQWPAAVQARW